jgi:hypothetical protein
MKRILCRSRLDAIKIAPKCTIIRRVAPGEYEAFKDLDEYYTHLLTIGKRVDARWLKRKTTSEAHLESPSSL